MRISLRSGATSEHKRAISDSIHRAMVETIGVPEKDKFQVLTEYDATGLVYDPEYLGINRSDGVLFVQITLNAGRTLEKKKELYARLAQRLAESPGTRPEDVLVSLVEVTKENWSFGNGIAQYAT